jgi:hypothetical protein
MVTGDPTYKNSKAAATTPQSQILQASKKSVNRLSFQAQPHTVSRLCCMPEHLPTQHYSTPYSQCRPVFIFQCCLTIQNCIMLIIQVQYLATITFLK